MAGSRSKRLLLGALLLVTLVAVAGWALSTRSNGLAAVRGEVILAPPPQSVEILRWERGKQTGVSLSGDLGAEVLVVWASRLPADRLAAYYSENFAPTYNFWLGSRFPGQVASWQGYKEPVGISVKVGTGSPVIDSRVEAEPEVPPAGTSSFATVSVLSNRV